MVAESMTITNKIMHGGAAGLNFEQAVFEEFAPDVSKACKAYKKCKRDDSEHDDWDAGSPCGDLADSSGEETTAGSDSLTEGGRDSDSSSGELSTADDCSPTEGERDCISSSSGGGSAADDVSPHEGRGGRDCESSSGDSAPLATTHRQEAEIKEPQATPVAHQAASPVTKAEIKEPQATPVAHQAASPVTKAEIKEPQATPVAHQAASPVTKVEFKEPQAIPVAHQAASPVTKAESREPQAIPVAHQVASPVRKAESREPQAIPVAHQVASPVRKGTNHERRGFSPVQAAIRSAIAASGNQGARPASSADVQAEMLVPALTSVLGHLVAMGCRKQRVTIFHATRVPQVSLVDYLRRIAAWYPCSDQGLVLGLVYLDRLLVKHPDFVVSALSVHRLLATALTLSSKFLNDISYRNEHYAKVAGMKAKELSFLEAHFLKLLDWRLNVSEEEFDEYQENILAAYPRGLIAPGPAAPAPQAPQVPQLRE